MKLEHVAIWTNNLELLKNFYVEFFEGSSNEKYINPTTGFESYFISFNTGGRLELMQRKGIPENLNDKVDQQYLGIIHLAFAVETMAEVDGKLELFKKKGIEILRGPRRTGDGYYEFETLDPDKNRLEIFSLYAE